MMGVIVSNTLDALRAFRTELSASFRHPSDALFELSDAAITAGTVPSLAHLSLEEAHRDSTRSPTCDMASETATAEE
jgi:hypothetical protein